MSLTLDYTDFAGAVIIRPQVFSDSRGHFLETFNRRRWLEYDLPAEFVQDNQSKSAKFTLRGLHFQRPPFQQGKLVRVIHGSALDIAVDLRKASPTYGHHIAIELRGDEHIQLYIPEGFAHGFITLEEDTIFAYKCTSYYTPEAEGGLPWNDLDLDIPWPTSNPVLAAKDTSYAPFSSFDSPF
ncbi:MAG: dTDP-4-dehydrorhamnose 3,5-epimerase [Bacteroidota bacterium]|nr:dTDP-4-dehydrorhamnose 3,5-epimerase [Bacteroidota bacterium]